MSIDKATVNSPAVTISRDCDIDISDYDTFIFFGSLPTAFKFNLVAVIDGKEVNVFNKEKGIGVSQEMNGSLTGERMTHISFEFYADEDGKTGTLSWLGLANSTRLDRMVNKKNHYDSEWKGYFIDRKDVVIKPEIEILFGDDELKEIREKMKVSPFKEIYESKKQMVLDNMYIEPEDYIGQYVPHYDKRWNRSRDKISGPEYVRNSYGMNSTIENIAFVGIIENDYDMLKMAARHAISIAHCEHWSESIMGSYPGATWHHRSFTENIYCKVVALALDWCGSLLTPFGKQVLRDSLAMKGLPRIESDFKRVEYIRYMNQGIVFSYGRIFAYLALLPKHPRYISNLKEAEEDLVSMVDNYIEEDGGTTEGPGYWSFTFGESISAFYALARQKKVDFTYYKDIFKKTGDFALSLMSFEDDGTVIVPINDAHPGKHMSCTIAASFYKFTKNENWNNLYEKLIAKNYVEDDSFALISAHIPKEKKEFKEETINRIYPTTGLLGSVRTGEDIKTLVILCSGITSKTHFNQDKGSIILETDGRTICPDCGSCYYFDSELSYVTTAIAHNLLNPILSSGELSVQGRHMAGGIITKSSVDGEHIDFASDDTTAWSDDVYKSITRRVCSPFAELCIVIDEFELGIADYAEFLLNSYGEYELKDNEAVSKIDDLTLRVKPLNWDWENAVIKEMQDGHHRKIWQLKAPTNKVRKQYLVTAISINKNIDFKYEKTQTGYKIEHGNNYLDVVISDDDIVLR